MSHIIVTGYGRSGTSLLYVMLAGTVQGYRFYDREVDALSVLSDEPKVTKRPLDLFNVQEIKQRIPDARWIVVIRDPRSCLCSKSVESEGYRLSWDTAWTGQAYPAPGLVARDRIIDRLGDKIVVRFEDLICDPDGVQERLAGELGLTMRGRFSDPDNWDVSDTFAMLMNGPRRPDKSRITSWRAHWPRVIEQFEEAPELFDILIKRGYEKDRSWFRRRLTKAEVIERRDAFIEQITSVTRTPL